MPKPLDQHLISFQQLSEIDPKEDGYQQKELEGRLKFYRVIHDAPHVTDIKFTSPEDRYNPADARILSAGTYYWVTIKMRHGDRHDEWIVDTKNLNEIWERKSKNDRIFFINIWENEVMLWNARQTSGKIERWAVASSVEKEQGRKLKTYSLFPDSTCTRFIL